MSRPTKYRAQRTNGYASKAEASYAATLQLRKSTGDILDWLEQVPIKLPGGIKYVCDFMLLHTDGSVQFVEIKGFETREWKLKRRLLDSERPDIAKRLTVIHSDRQAGEARSPRRHVARGSARDDRPNTRVF